MVAKKKAVEPAITEPMFNDYAASLATADQAARAASADAGQARAERSVQAVNTILSAFAEGYSGGAVKEILLDAGVLKGTVSKIVTVIDALYGGGIKHGDVKSLNGAYTSIIAARKAASTSPIGGVPFTVTVNPEPVAAPVPVTSPEDALKIILDSISAIGDSDEAFRVGGEWITKITTAVGAIIKAKEDGSEGDEDE